MNRLLNRLLNWHRDREVINDILTLSDRQLNDIGLRRPTVASVVKQGTYIV